MTRDDRGAVTVFATVFTVAVLFVFGLVYDGGRLLAAQRQADNEAAGAARAAAQALDQSSLRRGQVTRELDLEEAERRVCGYLTATGHGCDPASFEVIPTYDRDDPDPAPDGVVVEVHVEVPMPILGLHRQVVGEGSSCNELGVRTTVDTCPELTRRP
jgi:hypothetical protein